MSYPENLPSGIYQLREYDFGLNDPNLIPLDENTFKKGFRNKDESILESVPDAHQANWLYNYFNKHLIYTEKTALENKKLLETKVATPTNIGQIQVGYGLDISNSGVLSVSKGIAEDANIISYDLPVGSFMFWSGNNPPEYFIEPKGQTLPRATYPDLYQFAVSNGLIGSGKLFGAGDGSTTFTIADLRDQFVKIGASSEAVGRKEAEGLPNLTGSFTSANGVSWSSSFGYTADGKFYNMGEQGGHNVGNGGSRCSWRRIGFDASRNSDAVYGKSSRVTPRNVAFKLILKAKPTPPNKTVPIGSIMDYTGTTAPDGFIVANGAQLKRADFKDLYNWAVSNNLFKAKKDMPAEGSPHAFYGECDDPAYFRIPDLRGVFRRGADLQSGRGGSSVGIYQSDGLPNITGKVYTENMSAGGNGGGWKTGSDGALYITNGSSACAGGNNWYSTSNTINLNAQMSNPIYGSADHVRPRNVNTLPIIKY